MEELSGGSDSSGPDGDTPDIPESKLRECFHLSAKDACTVLGVSMGKLKRSCRLLGVSRWPSRKIKSLEVLRKTLTDDPNLQDDDRQVLLQRLEEQMAAVLADPDRPLDKLFSDMRQTSYKVKYHQRKSETRGPTDGAEPRPAAALPPLLPPRCRKAVAAARAAAAATVTATATSAGASSEGDSGGRSVRRSPSAPPSRPLAAVSVLSRGTGGDRPTTVPAGGGSRLKHEQPQQQKPRGTHGAPSAPKPEAPGGAAKSEGAAGASGQGQQAQPGGGSPSAAKGQKRRPKKRRRSRWGVVSDDEEGGAGGSSDDDDDDPSVEEGALRGEGSDEEGSQDDSSAGGSGARRRGSFQSTRSGSRGRAGRLGLAPGGGLARSGSAGTATGGGAARGGSNTWALPRSCSGPQQRQQQQQQQQHDAPLQALEGDFAEPPRPSASSRTGSRSLALPSLAQRNPHASLLQQQQQQLFQSPPAPQPGAQGQGHRERQRPEPITVPYPSPVVTLRNSYPDGSPGGSMLASPPPSASSQGLVTRQPVPSPLQHSSIRHDAFPSFGDDATAIIAASRVISTGVPVRVPPLGSGGSPTAPPPLQQLGVGQQQQQQHLGSPSYMNPPRTSAGSALQSSPPMQQQQQHQGQQLTRGSWPEQGGGHQPPERAPGGQYAQQQQQQQHMSAAGADPYGWYSGGGQQQQAQQQQAHMQQQQQQLGMQGGQPGWSSPPAGAAPPMAHYPSPSVQQQHPQHAHPRQHAQHGMPSYPYWHGYGSSPSIAPPAAPRSGPGASGPAPADEGGVAQCGSGCLTADEELSLPFSDEPPTLQQLAQLRYPSTSSSNAHLHAQGQGGAPPPGVQYGAYMGHVGGPWAPGPFGGRMPPQPSRFAPGPAPGAPPPWAAGYRDASTGSSAAAPGAMGPWGPSPPPAHGGAHMGGMPQRHPMQPHGPYPPPYPPQDHGHGHGPGPMQGMDEQMTPMQQRGMPYDPASPPPPGPGGYPPEQGSAAGPSVWHVGAVKQLQPMPPVLPRMAIPPFPFHQAPCPPGAAQQQQGQGQGQGTPQWAGEATWSWGVVGRRSSGSTAPTDPGVAPVSRDASTTFTTAPGGMGGPVPPLPSQLLRALAESCPQPRARHEQAGLGQAALELSDPAQQQEQHEALGGQRVQGQGQGQQPYQPALAQQPHRSYGLPAGAAPFRSGPQEQPQQQQQEPHRAEAPARAAYPAADASAAGRPHPPAAQPLPGGDSEGPRRARPPSSAFTSAGGIDPSDFPPAPRHGEAAGGEPAHAKQTTAAPSTAAGGEPAAAAAAAAADAASGEGAAAGAAPPAGTGLLPPPGASLAALPGPGSSMDLLALGLDVTGSPAYEDFLDFETPKGLLGSEGRIPGLTPRGSLEAGASRGPTPRGASGDGMLRGLTPRGAAWDGLLRTLTPRGLTAEGFLGRGMSPLGPPQQHPAEGAQRGSSGGQDPCTAAAAAAAPHGAAHRARADGRPGSSGGQDADDAPRPSPHAAANPAQLRPQYSALRVVPPRTGSQLSLDVAGISPALLDCMDWDRSPSFFGPSPRSAAGGCASMVVSPTGTGVTPRLPDLEALPDALPPLPYFRRSSGGGGAAGVGAAGAGGGGGGSAEGGSRAAEGAAPAVQLAAAAEPGGASAGSGSEGSGEQGGEAGEGAPVLPTDPAYCTPPPVRVGRRRGPSGGGAGPATGTTTTSTGTTSGYPPGPRQGAAEGCSPEVQQPPRAPTKRASVPGDARAEVQHLFDAWRHPAQRGATGTPTRHTRSSAPGAPGWGGAEGAGGDGPAAAAAAVIAARAHSGSPSEASVGAAAGAGRGASTAAAPQQHDWGLAAPLPPVAAWPAGRGGQLQPLPGAAFSSPTHAHAYAPYEQQPQQQPAPGRGWSAPARAPWPGTTPSQSPRLATQLPPLQRPAPASPGSLRLSDDGERTAAAALRRSSAEGFGGAGGPGAGAPGRVDSCAWPAPAPAPWRPVLPPVAYPEGGPAGSQPRSPSFASAAQQQQLQQQGAQHAAEPGLARTTSTAATQRQQQQQRSHTSGGSGGGGGSAAGGRARSRSAASSGGGTAASGDGSRGGGGSDASGGVAVSLVSPSVLSAPSPGPRPAGGVPLLRMTFGARGGPFPGSVQVQVPGPQQQQQQAQGGAGDGGSEGRRWDGGGTLGSAVDPRSFAPSMLRPWARPEQGQEPQQQQQ